MLGGRVTLELLQDHRRFQTGGGLIDGFFKRVLLHVAELVFVDHRTEHGIGLDQFDLRGQELVGIVVGDFGGFLAQHAGGHAAVDVDGRGGFVDGREAQGDDQRGEHRGGDAARNLPAVTAQDPQVVRQRDVRDCGS